ncbi:pentapeptide repeat-containing protein [Roseomonas sp. WA12]
MTIRPSHKGGGIRAMKPQGLRIVNVRTDVKKLFSKLGEALARASLAAPAGADPVSVFVAGAVGSIDAFGIKTPPEEKAWHLVRRAIATSVAQIMSEWPGSGQPWEGDVEWLNNTLELKLESEETHLDLAFFKNPKSFPLLEVVSDYFGSWLKHFGLSAEDALSLSGRFTTYFTFAIHDEWRKDRTFYHEILEKIDSPAGAAVQTEADWARYENYLQKMADAPVFGETFSLRSIYVPVRATFQVKEDRGRRQDSTDRPEVRDAIVMLHDEIESWVDNSSSGDAIKVIRGGPGCGKSTFLKMLATSLAGNGRHRSLFFPLQRFSTSEQLVSAIGSYLRNTQAFESNPINESSFFPVNGKIVLLFDGLDEITKPGETAEVEARRFLSELRTTLGQWNHSSRRVLAIVTGRDAVVQASRDTLRVHPRSELRILPLFFRTEASPHRLDPDNLSLIDQRLDWWGKYRAQKPNEPQSIPPNLLQRELNEITAEPLLLYLLVVSGFHKQDRSVENFNRNDIYETMFSEVLRRPYDRDANTSPSKPASDMEEILEAVATAAWYGDGRTASLQDVKMRCSERLRNSLDQIIVETGGVHRLVAAFYFQEAEGTKLAGKEAFEFTHKSFGEYLTARRIIREIASLHEALSLRRDYFTTRDALRIWYDLCSTMPIDFELRRFIYDEMRILHAQIRPWISTLSAMLQLMIDEGIHISQGPSISFRAAEARMRNAEGALLACLVCCASVSGTMVPLRWDDEHAAGSMVCRLVQQRYPGTDSLYLALNYLKLDGQNFMAQSFANSSFIGASLVGARLFLADVRNSDFSRADVRNTDFSECTIDGVNFSGSNLTNASFFRARLAQLGIAASDFTSLNGIVSLSDIMTAWNKIDHFTQASFAQAVMVRSNLSHGMFIGTDFRSADLTNCNLSHCHLALAKFEGAIVHGADFTYANLFGVDVEYLRARGAIIDHVDINFPRIEDLLAEDNFMEFDAEEHED